MIKKIVFVLVSLTLILGGFWIDHPGVKAAGTASLDTVKAFPQQLLTANVSGDSSVPTDTGGPDAFGYTWSDEVAYSWVPAATPSGLTGDDTTALAAIGFPFHFYENTYSEIYIATNGILVFGAAHDGCYDGTCGGLAIPDPSLPNNMVAPFSSDFTVGPGYNDGDIYLGGGGTSPNRYFVVEWRDVTDYNDVGGDDPYTFQAILHENGDILFQYQTMGFEHWAPTVGIEDSAGTDGLVYPYDPISGEAVRFQHPGLAPRIKVAPTYQGEHTHPGEQVTYNLTITNTGDLGTDTLNLTTNSTWPVTLYEADGTTPLTDTNGDLVIDTGPLAHGEDVAIVAKVTTPGDADLGDYNTTVITATSWIDPAVSKTGDLQASVPGPFAQTYLDGSDGILKTYLARPSGQVSQPTSPPGGDIWDMAIAETPGFVQVWRGTSSGASNLEFTLLDDGGAVVRPVTNLTDNSGATIETGDYDPAVVAAPDGHIGVIWQRVLVEAGTGNENYNIWFAILDAAGELVYGPQNITNNNTWGAWNDPDVAGFHQPVIAATGDNRFVLSWSYSIQVSSGYSTDPYLHNIYYQIFDSSGGTVKAATQLTDDALDVERDHSDSNLTPLSGDRVLVVWECDDGLTLANDICYAVIDSSGNLVKATTNASSTPALDGNPDAVQLSNGSTIITWHGQDGEIFQINYTLLDGAYDLVVGPVALSNPAATSGNSSPSVAAAGDKAVITWTDWDYDHHLYYALVGGEGSLLTPPMIFLTALSAENPELYTNLKGYGNTSYTIWEHQIYLPVVIR